MTEPSLPPISNGTSSFIGRVGLAVEAVVHALEGAVAQLLGRNCHVLEGQMVAERVVSQFHPGMVMISGAFLAHLQPLFGHRFHAVGIPTDRNVVSGILVRLLP